LVFWYHGTRNGERIACHPMEKNKHPGVFYGLMSLLILCLLPIGALDFWNFCGGKIHGA